MLSVRRRGDESLQSFLVTIKIHSVLPVFARLVLYLVAANGDPRYVYMKGLSDEPCPSVLPFIHFSIFSVMLEEGKQMDGYALRQ